MRFIKENPALAAGIGLPFLLVVLFSLATLIPQWTVAPPQYDVVFSVRDYQCSNDAEVHFKVVDGSIKSQYTYPKKENNYLNCSNNQRIYRFDTKTLIAKEVAFEIPTKGEKKSEWQEFEIPEIKLLKINNNPVAPDGYQFANSDGSYSGGVFPFGGSYYHNGVYIIKKGRVVNLFPLSGNRYYQYNDVNFLGWVVVDEAKK